MQCKRHAHGSICSVASPRDSTDTHIRHEHIRLERELHNNTLKDFDKLYALQILG